MGPAWPKSQGSGLAQGGSSSVNHWAEPGCLSPYRQLSSGWGFACIEWVCIKDITILCQCPSLEPVTHPHLPTINHPNPLQAQMGPLHYPHHICCHCLPPPQTTSALACMIADDSQIKALLLHQVLVPLACLGRPGSGDE